MKNQVTFLGLLVLLTVAITSCKKDVRSLEDRMTGKWFVDKVITVDTKGTSTTQAYSKKDFMNFALNINGYTPTINHQPKQYAAYGLATPNVNKRYAVLNLGNNQTSGSFEVHARDRFRLFLPDGIHDCMVNSIDSNQFQFTVKKYGSDLTKIYYLKRKA